MKGRNVRSGTTVDKQRLRGLRSPVSLYKTILWALYSQRMPGIVTMKKVRGWAHGLLEAPAAVHGAASGDAVDARPSGKSDPCGASHRAGHEARAAGAACEMNQRAVDDQTARQTRRLGAPAPRRMKLHEAGASRRARRQ